MQQLLANGDKEQRMSGNQRLPGGARSSPADARVDAMLKMVQLSLAESGASEEVCVQSLWVCDCVEADVKCIAWHWEGAGVSVGVGAKDVVKEEVCVYFLVCTAFVPVDWR